MKDLIELLGRCLACYPSHLLLEVILYQCEIYINDGFLDLALNDLLRENWLMLLSAGSDIFDSTDLLINSILHETSSFLPRWSFSLLL